jgi:hypothetical protein
MEKQMKKLTMLVMLFLIANPVLADGHANSNQLMNKDECSELKDGIAELLMISDYYWQELEKDTEKKELYEAIAFYSQQAANYSTIYDVWCD